MARWGKLSSFGGSADVSVTPWSRPSPAARQLRVGVGIVLAVLVVSAGCQETQQTRLPGRRGAENDRYDETTVGEVTTVGNAEPVRSAASAWSSAWRAPAAIAADDYRTMLEDELPSEGVKNVKGNGLTRPTTPWSSSTAVLPPGRQQGRPDRRGGDAAAAAARRPACAAATCMRLRPVQLRLRPQPQPATSAGPATAARRATRWPRRRAGAGRLRRRRRGRRRVKHGRIWGGGRLTMRLAAAAAAQSRVQQFARVASLVADRINETFHGGLRQRPDGAAIAKASNNLGHRAARAAAVPAQLPRYLRVVRLIPLPRRPPCQTDGRRPTAPTASAWPTTCSTRRATVDGRPAPGGAGPAEHPGPEGGLKQHAPAGALLLRPRRWPTWAARPAARSWPGAWQTQPALRAFA